MQNGGVLNARLKGIEIASGEWIGFVDGDDEIESDMYERLIKNAYVYGADISHCGYQTIVNNGERIHYFYNTGRMVEQNRVSGVNDLLSGIFVEPGLWNKLFKKSLFNALEDKTILKERIRINEDVLMNYLLFKQAQKSIYEDICPYHYMARNTSVTRSEFREYKVLDPLRVAKFILYDAEATNKDIACKRYIVCCMNAYLELYGNVKYKEKCLDLKKELLGYRDRWNLFGKTERIKLKLMLLLPMAYKIIYYLYKKYFQKKIYE